jgi:hypothetical protein
MNLSLLRAATILLAVSAAGCGMPGGASSVGAPSSVAPQAAAPLGVAPDARKKLAGKYDGTIEWEIGTSVKSGTLDTILRLHRKNILGPFTITMDGQVEHFRLYGRIKSKTPEQAVVVFLIYNNKKGGYATGTGTIVSGVFTGKAKSHAVGSTPSIPISFSVTKGQQI